MKFDNQSPPGPLESDARSKLKSLIAAGLAAETKKPVKSKRISESVKVKPAKATVPEAALTHSNFTDSKPGPDPFTAKQIKAASKIAPAMFRFLMNQAGLPAELDPAEVKAQFLAWMPGHPGPGDWRASWTQFAAEVNIPAPEIIEVPVAAAPVTQTCSLPPVPSPAPGRLQTCATTEAPSNIIPLPIPAPPVPPPTRIMGWRERLQARLVTT